MPKLYIHAINSEFQSSDTGAEYSRPEDALAIGVRSAASLLADEIAKGQPTAAIEVRVEQEDGTAVLRSAVSLSVAPLMPSLAARSSIPLDGVGA